MAGGLEVKIVGAATLAEVAAQISREGRKDLSRKLSSALNDVTVPVRDRIKQEAAATMPKSGWYANTFTKSLRFRNNRRAGGNRATLTMITYADGKGERRDIVALEHGILRHPLHGDREHWYVTKIRAGFHERATDQMADEVVDHLARVVRDFSARLIG